ncbi:MAG: hypothetical protein WCO19_04430 [Candidatus Saccharibacteria bacterium]
MEERITNYADSDPGFASFREFVNAEVHVALTLLELTNLEIDDIPQLHPTVLHEYRIEGSQAIGKYAMALYLYCGAEVDYQVETSPVSREEAERVLKGNVQALPDRAIKNSQAYWNHLGRDVKHAALQFFSAAHM